MNINIKGAAALLVPLSLLLAACGTAATAPPSSPQPAPSKPPQSPPTLVNVYKVQGEVGGWMTLPGNVVALNTASITTPITSVVTKVTVDVGSRLKQGDEMAELDHSALDAAVAEDQAAVDVAQAKLNQVQGGGRPDDIARAQAVVGERQATLDGLTAQGTQDSVAAAQAALDSAKAKLQALTNGPRSEEVAVLQSAVTVA